MTEGTGVAAPETAASTPPVPTVIVDGRPVAVTPENVARWQKAEASERRFQEAAEIRKAAADAIAFRENYLKMKAGDQDATRAFLEAEVGKEDAEKMLAALFQTEPATPPVKTKGAAETPPAPAALPPEVAEYFKALKDAGIDPVLAARHSAESLRRTEYDKVEAEITRHLADVKELGYNKLSKPQQQAAAEMMRAALNQEYVQNKSLDSESWKRAAQATGRQLTALGIKPPDDTPEAFLRGLSLGGGESSDSLPPKPSQPDLFAAGPGKAITPDAADATTKRFVEIMRDLQARNPEKYRGG